MARNETFISAAPQVVFELLGDPSIYADWVVGSREIQAAEPSWPEQGAGSTTRWAIRRSPSAITRRSRTPRAHRPLGHASIRLRNAESLRRLKALAEATRPRPRGRAPRSRDADDTSAPSPLV
jgi:hypothetical protein